MCGVSCIDDLGKDSLPFDRPNIRRIRIQSLPAVPVWQAVYAYGVVCWFNGRRHSAVQTHHPFD
jgi:hypothetical protein